MKIQTRFNRTVRGMLTKITVIALMAMIGVIVNTNNLAVDYGIQPDMATRQSE